MPSSRVLVLLIVLGLMTYCHILATPIQHKFSETSGIHVFNCNPGILVRVLAPANYVEMKRTKLLRGQYSYTLGERITGDKLADQQEYSDDFPAARDVEARISYPSTEKSLTLTHISILVEQSSEDGAAYVVEGGVNQKFAEILIIANATLHYAHSGTFYGY